MPASAVSRSQWRWAAGCQSACLVWNKFAEFAVYEREATELRTFDHTLFPGLLQTEDYARAVLERHARRARSDGSTKGIGVTDPDRASGGIMEQLDSERRKATYSRTSGNGCVEAATSAGRVLVRDTTDRDGGTLVFGAKAWAASLTDSRRS